MNVQINSTQIVSEWNFIRSNYPNAKVKNLYPNYPAYRRDRKFIGKCFETIKAKLS
jgi:hypothetical protein